MISLINPSDPEEVYRELRSVNPDAMIIMGFESAYLGMTAGYAASAVYDYEECIHIMSVDNVCDYNEAERIVNEEIVSQCCFDDSPVFVRVR